MRQEWTSARRVVVKIGSALLVDRGTGALRADWLATLIDDVTGLKARGADVILVSSGAIALGRKVLGLGTGALRLEESQAAAAVGQVHLAAAYESQFRARNIKTAQVLLTVGDTEQRRRYLNARNTMQTLLGFGVIPVVNENDTVATTEIRYGDNDRLAARVASMCNADCLVLLSDIDGLYTAPPQKDPTATRLDVVTDITPEIEAMAGDVGSELSRGGMITKIQAAKIAVAAGCHMAITTGKVFHPLAQFSTDAPATWFLARGNPAQAYKRWISGSLQARGSITIDDGAVAALLAGKSLLPAGVVSLDGQFERGDAVVIRDRAGHELGRGLVAYDRRDADRIRGHKSDEIAEILGYAGRAALIHRDDMVIDRKTTANPG